MAKVLVRADATSPVATGLGTPFGGAVRRADGVLVVGSGPDEWLLLGPPGAAGRLIGELLPGSTDENIDGAPRGVGRLVSVVDLTHGRALVRITGSESASTLAKVCPIDLRDRSTPDGSAFRSTVGKLTVDVIRDDARAARRADTGWTRSYLLHCERSTGQHLFDVLLDAGAEFEIDVDGFDAAGT